MDVNVAVVQLRQSALADRSPTRTLNPVDYDILLLTDGCLPTTSQSSFSVDPLDEPPPPLRQIIHDDDYHQQRPRNNSVRKESRHLPRYRLSTNELDPSEGALKLIRRLAGPNPERNRLCRRAVQVGLWKSEASSVSSNNGGDVFFAESRHYGMLYCVPILERDKQLSGALSQKPGASFENLGKLLGLCHNQSDSIDAESRHLILRLEEWLREKQQRKSRFLTNLFLRSPAFGRVRLCAHNPAYEPEETRTCHGLPTTLGIRSRKRHGGPTNGSLSGVDSQVAGEKRRSCELADEVRKGNDARAKMFMLEKYDVFIMNPLFGAGLHYHAKNQAPGYFSRGRPSLASIHHRHSLASLQASSSTGSPPHGSAGSAGAQSWAEEFPLHHSAYMGQPDMVRQLLAQGHDSNQADRDSWTPLHYAAWYGNLETMQVLLNYGNCNVNLRNKHGSTALHFAALYGKAYMVELLLSHPGITVDAVDADGKTPLQLCECVPKPDLQEVATLLKSAGDQKLAKIQVDMLDGSNAMLSLVTGLDTTSAQLHEQMCNELKLSEPCRKLFGIWICSDSLELQLKAEHKPVMHMQKWKTKVLPKWSDSTNASAEEPKLVFRRDARAALASEKQVNLTDTTLSLLYEEARQNYLRGKYPCSDQDAIALAGIMMQIIHGNYDAKKDKAHLANDKTLRMLLPAHKLRSGKGLQQLLSKIMQEHKLITTKGARFISGLQYQFLSFCWNLCVYGSTFFDAIVFMTKPIKGDLNVVVGVNDCGLHLINAQTKDLFETYPLNGLEWTYKPEHTYLEVRAKHRAQTHAFTISTRQASHINMLLMKMTSAGNSRASSRANLSQTS